MNRGYHFGLALPSSEDFTVTGVHYKSIIGEVARSLLLSTCPLTSTSHTTQMSVFSAWWTERFGDTLPLGHALRSSFPDRWFRIHSLPESKRYANDDGERRVLLDRQELLADEVLGQKEPCFIVTPYEDIALGMKRKLAEFPNQTFSCELRGTDEPEEPDISCLVAEVSWDATDMKPALLAIAQDQLRALWINRNTNAIFAPYDGGVDVVLESRAQRDVLRDHFSQWLSARSDGL